MNPHGNMLLSIPFFIIWLLTIVGAFAFGFFATWFVWGVLKKVHKYVKNLPRRY